MIRITFVNNGNFDTEIWNDVVKTTQDNINSSPFTEIFFTNSGELILKCKDDLVEKESEYKICEEFLSSIGINQLDIRIENIKEDNCQNATSILQLYLNNDSLKKTYQKNLLLN